MILLCVLGSIAKRHIRNLKIVCKERKILLHIDVVRRANSNAEKYQELGIRNVYTEVSELMMQYDTIFITNPTELHLETLEKYYSYGKSFFIEKPISSVPQIRLAENILQKSDVICYVACPLRYSAVIQYIKTNIDINKIISVRSISSSYLPEWRQGVDYRNTYSSNRDLGGGVDIDLIHEWDYLTYLFGFPDSVKWIHGKKSKLDIDSDDFAIYMAEYKSMIVELHLDYFGRSTIRELMLIMEDETVIGDLVKNEIRYLKEDKKICFNEKRDDYQIRELDYFIDMIQGKTSEDNDILHAVKVLKLTQGEL